MANGSDVLKLEHRLLLLGWLNSLLGFKENSKLLEVTKSAKEGYDPYGQSYLKHLIAGLDNLKLTLPELTQYDENIRAHLSVINKNRSDPIILRYFQYLSLLYTEIVLDRLFNTPHQLLQDLNAYVAHHNSANNAGQPQEDPFTKNDLTKLAYWMATGSGKTLIMHINYLQFLHYNKKPLDNILLITPPGEALSEQHLSELVLSGIPCRRFQADQTGLSLGRNIVRVIEITKLTEEKKGEGLRVDVNWFEGNNLIFVDEGHKGSGGQAWRNLRDKLGQTGFTFEYSATFGQALTASRNDELTAEYGKAIIFDYSYKYFYGDGYGKDFDILNLRDEISEEQTNILMTANLLNYFEQKYLFISNRDAFRPYNIELPLWVFVGSSVNAVFTEDKKRRSDVLTVARFLHKFLENKRDWSVKTIDKILSGKLNLKREDGSSIFENKFVYLLRLKKDAAKLYSLILSSIFHTTSAGSLHLCDIRGSAGELGLKAGESQCYFGLIYIGDTIAFKKLLEADDGGIVLEEDAISKSLFEQINRPDSSIHILIGAKKFMEGWSSWRVSNMGLLNIGKQEGSLIIQLFGRGVRLLGRDRLLKRSEALDGEHPDYIKLLETLNIFAVRANYMSMFRDYLEREGVPVEGKIAIPLKIKINQDFLKQGLLIPALPQERSFIEECPLLLHADPAIKVRVDLSIRVQTLQSAAAGLQAAQVQGGREITIPKDALLMLNWDDIYLKCMEYKQQMGFSNLIIQPNVLQEILDPAASIYTLIADNRIKYPSNMEDLFALEEAVLSILRRYMERFYYIHQNRWESKNAVYIPLDKSHENFQDLTIKLPRSEKQLIKDIMSLIKEAKKIYTQQTHTLPNIHFDRHLYQPLLVWREDKIEVVPPRLEESEERFVEELKQFALNGRIPADKELFLLRNLGKGKGIGFFNNFGVYPDFILWIKESNGQKLIFIEPHGMRHEKSYSQDDRARLHEELKKLEADLHERTKTKNISLDSYIISATKYDDLKPHYGEGDWSKDKFTEHHILFFEDDYLPLIFESTVIQVN